MNKLLTLFIITQLIGIYVLNYYQNEPLPYGQMALEDNGIFSILEILIVLIIMSVIILLLFKKKKHKYWKYFYAFALFSLLSVGLYPFFKELALLISIIAILLRFKTNDIAVHNSVEIFTYGAAASIISPGLNPLTGIILLIAISVYDWISVYKTKHMIKLAEGSLTVGNFPGIITQDPGKMRIKKTKKGGRKSFFALGGGDLAFPLIFTGIFINNPIIVLGCFLGSTIGLHALFKKGESGKFYPAMPPIAIGLIIGWLISTGISVLI